MIIWNIKMIEKAGIFKRRFNSKHVIIQFWFSLVLNAWSVSIKAVDINSLPLLNKSVNFRYFEIKR